MCNPLAVISTGLQVAGAISQKSAADKAASAARAAGEFNAKIIERDADLLEKTRGILNANFLVQTGRAFDAFQREVQGAAKAGFGYGGFDMSSGSTLAVLEHNAREFDFEQKIAQFENSIQNMQIDDEQEGLMLSAELSRMEGGMAAATAQAQGTASLINSLSNVATTVYQNPGDFGLA